MNDAISTAKAEKVVNAPQNPVLAARKRNFLGDLAKNPTTIPKAADPEILIRSICQGHWFTEGRSSRSPHLAVAPATPPRKTADI